MSKVLVTGGTGYIGSHTVVELINEGFEVVIVDNLSNSNIEVLDGIEKITGIRPVFENIDCVDYVAMDNFIDNMGISMPSSTSQPVKQLANQLKNRCFIIATI